MMRPRQQKGITTIIRYRELSPTGDYVFGRGAGEFLVDSSAAVAQAILTRLKLWRSEWFLDLTVGTPWLQEIVGRHGQAGPPGQPLYDVALKTVILNTLGVTGILTYSSHFDSVGRTLTVAALVQTLFSTTPIAISQTLGGRPPFVLGSTPLG